MPRVERFDLEFVGQSPDDLSDGTLYMSMLDCMGTPVQRFGDSTGPLRGLMG